jgi:hypothetical protein
MARTATSDERLVLAQFEDFVNLNGTRLLHTAYGLCGGLAACRGSGPEGSGDRGGAMVAAPVIRWPTPTAASCAPT